MSKLAKALTAAAGNAGESLYVEDVFSTYLYTGDGGAGQTITNGIDLSGEGGMVWFKTRSSAHAHNIYDTVRGNGKMLYGNTAETEYTNSTNPWTPSSTGFNTGDDFGGSENQSGSDTVAWTFRKAEKFFDVFTYTGTGSNQTISHSLGSVPGFIIVRSLSGDNWYVWHSSLPTGALDSSTGHKRLILNTTAIEESRNGINTVTSTSFDVLGTDGETNYNGTSYVAYVFANDAGGFGDDGSESIIKCGSYTGNGSTTGPIINLGFEPQWVMIKNITFANDWWIFDSMRGITSEGADSSLRANITGTENTGTNALKVTATGFQLENGGGDYNGSTQEYIYIAIRRPMKTPESGAEVFAVGTNQEVPSATSGFYSGFPVDMAIKRIITASQSNYLFDRLRGGQSFATNATGAESAFGAAQFDHQQGFYYDSDSANTDDYSWMFKRARGFFDVVTYTGTGVVRTVNHNLGVAPEFIICKNRQEADGSVYSAAISDTKRCRLFSALGNIAAENRDAGDGTNYGFTISLSTDSTIRSGIGHETNKSGYKFVAYLFATLAGVSKVGSYTGTGSNIDVDCGFSAGARFILIKRTDSASSWYLWDSKRGIVAGNDPWINLDTNNAQNSGQDAIDPLASGFTVTAAADVNQPGGTYTFLAIA